MARNPNQGGKGPKVTKQSGNKGPIFGKMTSPHRHHQAVGPLEGNQQGCQGREQEVTHERLR